jgi:hypothetical protein
MVRIRVAPECMVPQNAAWAAWNVRTVIARSIPAWEVLKWAPVSAADPAWAACPEFGPEFGLKWAALTDAADP